jgi:phosphopantetheinyl transferase
VKGIAIALRPVRPVEAASLTPLLPKERALLGARATRKRRAEFLAGRTAARAALVRLLGPGAREAAVLRDEAARTARPVAVSADGAPLPAFVSISHAAGIAAAAAARDPIGLDLVLVEPQDAAFVQEAFWPDEIAAWTRFVPDPASGPLAACMAFAAKETALKWLGTGLALPLLGVRVLPAGPARPARVGKLRALSFPLLLEAPRLRRRLMGCVARFGRYVLVIASGPAPAGGLGGA